MSGTRETVSVVIPNFNQSRTLAACVEAALAQTYQPIEVIVADDRSTDDSRRIARALPCTLVELPVNRGAAAARNAGVAASRGDVVFFVDSDIVLRPDAVAQAMRVLREDPACGLVQGIYDKQPLYGDGVVETYKTLHEYFWRRRSAGVVRMTLFALGAMPREVFDETGGFDERVREIEDVVFGTRMSDRWTIRLTDTVVGRHDDVDRLLPMLRTQFRRARMLTSAVAGGGRNRVRAFSPTGLLASVAALATLPLALLSPWLLLVPAGLLAIFLASERGLLAFVGRERGPVYTISFAALHYAVYVMTVAGAAAGVPGLALRAVGGSR
ncbi:glycosyltransferase family 2 protein [Catenuloplanes atrovinosus]|uniref:Glycosyltransferase involved in cell wall biosynthesis n=1 Tax=Catenuloplanes atrovinosus TaxID=137266 RepID=A0AAE3YL20_9ACTN|nr:glycosyltransferase family 2 protein [Catenuloplanes atrovinosus]MDR7274882.1 glycosyltransferase involved in cell wall biosynthesis [Catenuloplanes atrovinosus]